MSKQQIIDEIRRLNRSVAAEFLGEFEDRELASYLERLRRLAGQRGRATVWVRPGDTHAVVASIG